MRRRLGRAARAIATVAVLVAVVAVVGLAATGRISNLTAAVAGAAPTPAPETAEDRATTAVARRTLALTDEVDGTLGYRGEISILAMLDGTLTRQPDEGTLLERGDVVYEVDEIRRAVLMYGDRPAWRAMGPDMPNGADVRQLEENLNAFGFLEDYEVDRAWDDDTTDAVEDWQEATGKTDDGTIELGEIVFLPGPVRIAEMAVVLGQRVGGGQAVMDATSTTRVVTVALDAGRTDLVALDDAVTIELPDGTETAGTISSVGRVAHAAESTEPGDSSSPTIDVEITLDDPA